MRGSCSAVCTKLRVWDGRPGRAMWTDRSWVPAARSTCTLPSANSETTHRGRVIRNVLASSGPIVTAPHPCRSLHGAMQCYTRMLAFAIWQQVCHHPRANTKTGKAWISMFEQFCHIKQGTYAARLDHACKLDYDICLGDCVAGSSGSVQQFATDDFPKAAQLNLYCQHSVHLPSTSCRLQLKLCTGQSHSQAGAQRRSLECLNVQMRLWAF